MISRETSMKRVVLVRIAPGEDILLGLRQAVQEHNIKNGLILTGFGSCSHSHFHVVMSNELPPQEELSQEHSAARYLLVQRVYSRRQGTLSH